MNRKNSLVLIIFIYFFMFIKTSFGNESIDLLSSEARIILRSISTGNIESIELSNKLNKQTIKTLYLIHKDFDKILRRATYQWLAYAKVSKEAAVLLLLNGVVDEEPDNRVIALSSLIKLKDSAKPCLPILKYIQATSVLNNDYFFRHYLDRCIKSIESSSEGGLPEMPKKNEQNESMEIP